MVNCHPPHHLLLRFGFEYRQGRDRSWRQMSQGSQLVNIEISFDIETLTVLFEVKVLIGSILDGNFEVLYNNNAVRFIFGLNKPDDIDDDSQDE